MNLEIVDSWEPLSEAELKAIENEAAVVLPSDYREFLQRFNGGRFADRVVFHEAGGIEFAPVHRGDGGVRGLYPPTTCEPAEWEDQLIVIGFDDGGRELCIAHGCKHAGQVLAVDTVHGYTVVPLARSFREFLESVEVDPDAQLSEPDGPFRWVLHGI